MKFGVKSYTIDCEENQPFTIWMELEYKVYPKSPSEAKFFFERIAGLLHGSEVEIMNAESEVGK